MQLVRSSKELREALGNPGAAVTLLAHGAGELYPVRCLLFWQADACCPSSDCYFRLLLSLALLPSCSCLDYPFHRRWAVALP